MKKSHITFNKIIRIIGFALLMFLATEFLIAIPNNTEVNTNILEYLAIIFYGLSSLIVLW